MATFPSFGVMRRAVATAATALIDGVMVDAPPRCRGCGRPLGQYAARPWSLRCRHSDCPARENRSAPTPTPTPTTQS